MDLPVGLSSKSTVAEGSFGLNTGIGQAAKSLSYIDSVNSALRLLKAQTACNSECIQHIIVFYGLDLDDSNFVGAMRYLLEHNLVLLPGSFWGSAQSQKERWIQICIKNVKHSPSLIVLARIIKVFNELRLIHREANIKDVCTLEPNEMNVKNPTAKGHQTCPR
jgi:hypothetical protein